MNDLNINSGKIKVNKKAAFHNLGCKVNSYELDIMRQILLDRGYEEVPFHEKADVYVVNTCTVTNIADRKSRQMLHRAKKQNPDAVVIAAGCYVETGRETVLKDGAVDLVVGNSQKAQIGELLEAYFKERARRENSSAESKTSAAEESAAQPENGAGGSAAGFSVESENPAEVKSTAQPENGAGGSAAGFSAESENPAEVKSTAQPENGAGGSAAGFSAESDNPAEAESAAQPENPAGFEHMRLTNPGRTRAYIKIQDGCNQFCSYCVIPFARGRIRSREKAEILREAEGLVKSGTREIVLTGIHVSSYGLDRGPAPARFDPEKSAAALLDLLEGLDAIDGLERIRFSSLEPRIMTETFVRALSEHEKVCPHFHLSLQSGCDATLRRMNRHYTAEEYAAGVELLRKYYDRPAITTDVIVGFPGETEAEFMETVSFLERIRFYEIHVFRYSRRNGTAAAKMKLQIPEPVKALRSDQLLSLTAKQAAAYRSQFAGERQKLLIEEPGTDEAGDRYWLGSTSRYVTGAIPAGEAGSPELSGYRPGMLVEGRFGTDTLRFNRGGALLFSPEPV